MNIKSKIRFLKRYKYLSLVILAMIVSLVLALTGLSQLSNLILAIVSGIAAIMISWEMLQTIRLGRYGVDILAAVAIISSVLLKEYWTAIIIVAMYTGGKSLEDFAEHRAKRELTQLMKNAPTSAHLKKKNEVIDVKVSEIKIKDTLLIKPGEVVPVDSEIIEGSSSFDESSLTGESLPVDKTVGDQILSGTINVDGTIVVVALRDNENSQFEQIVKLVKSASVSRAPFVRMADKYSIPFTIVAFFIAGGAWLISGEAIRFLEVIVVATPCPLLLGAPIALISGMSRGTKFGIISKTGSAFEKLAKVKTIAFDKTGTLTMGHPKVDKIMAMKGYEKKDIVLISASLSQNANHVLSKTIVDEAHKREYKLLKTKNVQEISGKGLIGVVGGKPTIIGRLSFMSENDIDIPSSINENNISQTTTFVAVQQKIVGAISFKDEIRENAKLTLQQLRDLGVDNFLMVTGDNKTVANSVAKELGINNVQSECLPSDKLLSIEKVEQKPVAFIGDGVNDAPVLTAADVGIALGARGSTAASESADIVIMLDDISKVAKSVSIAKRTFYIARQSVLVGIFISVGLMAIFSTGLFKPIYGALIQEVVDVIVIVNALRARS